MKTHKLIYAGRIALIAVVLVIAGCKKKTPPPPTTPPPAAQAPTASLSANPSSVQPGQAVQLTWKTENATDVSLEGIGAVQASGSQSVTPSDSTTYRLVAKGPGGTQEATARVTVQAPPPVQAAPPPPSLTDDQLFAQNIKDAYFDYDSFEVRPADQQSLAADAQFLSQHPNWNIVIEGHCDDRGSTEYNMALGDSRAQATKQALLSAGVNASRIKTVSFGKEKPFCSDSNEQCWQENRRGHLVLQH